MIKLDELLLDGAGEVLTAAQAARELGYTRETINLAARSGELRPFAKLPGRNGANLFARVDLETWAASPARKGGRTVYGAPEGSR